MKALKEGGDLGADQIEWFLFGGTKKNVCGGARGGSLVLCWAGSFEKIANFRPFCQISCQPLQCPHLSCGGGEAMVWGWKNVFFTK